MINHTYLYTIQVYFGFIWQCAQCVLYYDLNWLRVKGKVRLNDTTTCFNVWKVIMEVWQPRNNLSQ